MSRMRSPVISRSNCAKREQHVESQPSHAGRRVEGWVTEMNDTSCDRKFDQLGEVGKRARQPVDLVDDNDVNPAALDVPAVLQRRPFHRAAGEAAIVVALASSIQPSCAWLST